MSHLATPGYFGYDHIMPKRTKAEYNAHMRKYMARRYAERRILILERLGGVCTRCGAEDDLEIDHIDASSKSFNIGARLAGIAKTKLEAELKKCQLLCKPCHQEKSIYDRGHKPAKGTHGTLSSYLYCRCDLCRAAKAEYMRNYKRRRKKSTN